MWKRLAVLLTVLALVAAACGDDDGPAATPAPATDAPGPDATTAPTAPDVGQSAGGTLAAVLARGVLRCGVGGAAVAFSETQPDGNQLGFDADFCRALAAAVLGDASLVEFRPVTAAERFDVLKSGEIDVLFRNTTRTQSRDAAGEGGVNVDFGPTTYYDGQGLMGLSSRFTADSDGSDIDGAILCTNAGTTTEKNITEYANLAGADIILETSENFNDAITKFKAGQCDLVTTDASGLVGNKINNERDGSIAEGEWVIFPRAPISKEPLGPAVRQNDSEWLDIVTWLIFATFIAHEKGITSVNIDTVEWDPEAARLFGGEGEVQSAMNLPADGYYQAIKQMGNFAEIFDRNLNPLDIVREGTLNDLFTRGGMIYAPPAR
jgi:general L-amino acid transport system substrate-binding protein